jgi:hypothetical protein
MPGTQYYSLIESIGCNDPLYVAEELGQPLHGLGQSSNGEDVRLERFHLSTEVSQPRVCETPGNVG